MMCNTSRSSEICLLTWHKWTKDHRGSASVRDICQSTRM